MFGKIENGIIVTMPTSGTDKTGCLFIVDGTSNNYAFENGYKEVICDNYPDLSNPHIQIIKSEDESHIYVTWINPNI